MESNRAFGDFLRSRRIRFAPDKDADPHRRPRRTPGLKREKVAQRAGIIVEWYVKLEQGRAKSPSAATLDALARALRLDDIERSHLHRLAGASERAPFAMEPVPEALVRLVASLPGPAYLTGQRWDVLALNCSAADLFDGFRGADDDERPNLLSWMLSTARARLVFGESWAAEAQRLVSLFRATHDRWSGDKAFDALLSRLDAGCPAFAGWWRSHDIGAPVSGIKLLDHPALGRCRYEYASFQANDDPRLKLALYARLD